MYAIIPLIIQLITKEDNPNRVTNLLHGVRLFTHESSSNPKTFIKPKINLKLDLNERILPFSAMLLLSRRRLANK